MSEEKPEITIQLLRADSIKEIIRKEFDLPAAGIILKSSIRTSPSRDKYELVTNSFLTRFNQNIDNVEPEFLGKMRLLE